MKLKLYVWENVLTDYTEGIMFALAESPDWARSLILKKWASLFDKKVVNLKFRTSQMRRIQSYLKNEPKCIEAPEGFLVWGGG